MSPCHLVTFACLLTAGLLAGCGSPNKANIELRKKNQALEEQVRALETQVSGQRAQVAALEAQIGTVPTLPQDRLDRLITVHGLTLGRLTGSPIDRPSGPPGFKVYVTPVDERGTHLRNTGTVTVETYELTDDAKRTGLWTFGPEAMRNRWRSLGPLNAFVLECPWEQPPATDQVTLKVTFRDELTGRVFTEVREIGAK